MALFGILLLASVGTPRNPAAESSDSAALLDLREWDVASAPLMDLHGAWYARWGRFLDPAARPDAADGDVFGVPGFWTGLAPDGAVTGHATFWVELWLPATLVGPDGPELALLVDNVQTAYRLYVDGALVSSAGTIAADAESSRPQGGRSIGHFRPAGERLVLVMHVSNHETVRGGPWEGIHLGTVAAVEARHTRSVIGSALLAAAIIALGLYHIGWYMALRREREALWFGLFAVLIGLRTLVTGPVALLALLPELSWAALMRIEYLSFYASLPLFSFYLHRLFPDRFSLRFRSAAGLLAAPFIGIALLAPTIIMTGSLVPFQVLTVLTGLGALAILARAMARGEESGFVLLGGFVVMFAAAINDILYANGLVDTALVFPIGLFMFILSQVFMLIRRYSRLFVTVTEQRHHLELVNDLLERELVERTELEKTMRDFSRHLEESRSGLIVGLARLAESRDTDTGMHLDRISAYTRILAQELRAHPDFSAELSDEFIDEMCQSSALHDIGKVGIPDAILQKPGRLTPEEFEVMKTHTTIGGDAIRTVESRIELNTFLRIAREIAYSHHEKWDGTGYPQRLAGEVIPLSARIVACADVYDALTSVRPYKQAMEHERAATIIREGRGSHFDPRVVTAFENSAAIFDSVRERLHLDETEVLPVASVDDQD